MNAVQVWPLVMAAYGSIPVHMNSFYIVLANHAYPVVVPQGVQQWLVQGRLEIGHIHAEFHNYISSYSPLSCTCNTACNALQSPQSCLAGWSDTQTDPHLEACNPLGTSERLPSWPCQQISSGRGLSQLPQKGPKGINWSQFSLGIADLWVFSGFD